MKRMIVLTSVLALFALLPANAGAIASLSKPEAKAATTSALLRYYDDLYRHASEKTVYPDYRASRTRWILSYQFEYASGEACYGGVTTWRGRNGRIFSDIRPHPDLGSPCR